MLINLGPHSIEIEFESEETSSADVYGQYHPKRALVQISNTVPKATQQETLLHELIHVAWEHSSLTVTDYDQELVARALSLPLLMILQNPQVVEFLAKDKFKAVMEDLDAISRNT